VSMTTRTEQAHHAIRAAQERKVWGDYAARRYCALRGVHPGLYRLARQLEAVDRCQKGLE